MIRTITARTEEIDSVDIAVREIREQLDLEKTLCKNSVGILACHYEFIFSGVAKALCESLPFEVVGTITSAQAVPAGSDTLLLTIMVLTSDDVSFKTALTDSLLGNPDKAIGDAYAAAGAGEAKKPSLIYAFAGFMVENSGDAYMNTLTSISGGVACFGTLSIDDTADFRYSFMLHNGEHYRDRMAMLLLYGDIQPKFYIATISENKIIDRAALITGSEGHILKEVNGRPVLEYFMNLGLTKAAETGYAMTSLPFMLDYGDGTPPVSKVFISLNEDKHAICAGAMPEGATLYLGVFDREDVLKTTHETLKTALEENPNASGILIYSCVSRSMSLAGDPYAELTLVRDEIAGSVPFMMAYSGGEMCPTQVSGDKAINRFHNNAFILCIF